jgi:hypothetical protein
MVVLLVDPYERKRRVSGLEQWDRIQEPPQTFVAVSERLKLAAADQHQEGRFKGIDPFHPEWNYSIAPRTKTTP